MDVRDFFFGSRSRKRYDRVFQEQAAAAGLSRAIQRRGDIIPKCLGRPRWTLLRMVGGFYGSPLGFGVGQELFPRVGAMTALAIRNFPSCLNLNLMCKYLYRILLPFCTSTAASTYLVFEPNVQDTTCTSWNGNCARSCYDIWRMYVPQTTEWQPRTPRARRNIPIGIYLFIAITSAAQKEICTHDMYIEVQTNPSHHL